jgi:hypothetical protein
MAGIPTGSCGLVLETEAILVALMREASDECLEHYIADFFPELVDVVALCM